MKFNQKEYTPEQIRDSVVKHLLKIYQDTGLITSDMAYEQMYLRLTSQISSGAISSKHITTTGRTKAEDYNEIFNALYIDLLTVFEKMNIAGNSIEDHRKLHQSIISANNTKLDILSDNIERLEDRLTNASDDYIYIERFRNTDSFETDISLYTDADFNLMAPASFVSYNKHGEFITLPRSQSINKITAGNGQPMAKLRINKQHGSGLISIHNPLNTIDKAIDTSRASYWEETIYADEPIQIELGESYWYHDFGALCEIEVIFSSLVTINEIDLSPYGAYPIDVLGIKYYTTDDPEQEELAYGIQAIVSPDNDEYILRSTSSSEYLIYQFPNTIVKRLRIILNQRHYIRNSLIVDKSESEKNDMWFHANDDTHINLKVRQSGIYQDKNLLDRLWLMLSQKIQSFDIDKVKQVLFPKNTEKVPVTRFEYNYGLYNISVNETDYGNTGIYISKPIKLNKNISSVKLSVDAVIPDSISSCRIDYYLSTEISPKTKADWIRIEPNSDDEIDFAEMLNSGNLEPFISKELYISNRIQSIKLNHMPYIDFGYSGSKPTATLYLKVNITDKRGKLISSRNVTDYFNTGSSNHNFTSDAIIQYYMDNGYIYFNQKIPTGYQIEITYKHFIDTLRLKAIFWKMTSESGMGITPTLREFKLHYNILE